MMLHNPIAAKTQKAFENPFFRPDDAALHKIIQHSFTADPSMKSMAYIKMTGRKGLSCFQGRFAPVLFSAHPNLSDTTMIYSSAAEGALQDIFEISRILKMSGKTVQIVRIPDSVSAQWSDYFGKPAHDEKILDYKYPVQILDVYQSAAMKGTRFLKFRNKLNAIAKIKPRVAKLTFTSAEKISLKNIVQQWAPIVFNENHQSETDYISYALNELTRGPGMCGLMAYINEKPAGFTLWENPAPGHETANSLIHCCVHERGLSEYLHHEMMGVLKQDGIRYLSLGGAETQGLDAFKRKMNPVLSVKLKTITL